MGLDTLGEGGRRRRVLHGHLRQRWERAFAVYIFHFANKYRVLPEV